ncbi:MAG: hypothetical protein ETSY1_42375 [Candidatus Entotheonella factor]|uniref:Uncharacterized protein n=1 Tax=Entotheonella factor TaxID=1429438 RepID=W4L3P9_ENTF1|nr:tetratricopeptide repeat protein [Candidatus Entotheonella palauensis]ETW92728.1 MAG: hypothetical protein ETSY1_42375 [Candidatus Entotheonella factor]
MKVYTKSFIAALVVMAVLLTGLSSVASDRDGEHGDEMKFINLMDKYLALSQRVAEIASQPDASVFLAIEGIVEIYEERGEMDQAIEHLNRVIKESPNNRSLRTIARFKLREIYGDLDMRSKALSELDQIIADHRQ